MTITPLKIIFAGTPEFASVALETLIKSPHHILAVYTQPDRRAGRGLKLKPSPVKKLALKNNIPIYQPASLKDPKEQALLASFNADVMVVAAYGMLLPPAVLRIPHMGCINIHPSLLPRWRGAAPIQRTIFSGDRLTGVTVMQMDEGLDTGPILLQHQYVLDYDETSQTLHDKLAKMGADSLVETLELLAQGKIQRKAQDNSLATYASKITKEEALIDWREPAIELEHKIRAFNPWPVAYILWQGQHLRIWMAKAMAEAIEEAIEEKGKSAPGTILHASRDGIDIATNAHVLRLLQVQLPGGKVMSVEDFYNAKRDELVAGEMFA